MSEITNGNFDETDENSESYITLTDDNGEEISFEFLDRIELNGRNYAVLLPFDDEEGEVIILEILSGEEEDEEEYVSVEDEELLNAVFEEFKKRNADEFDFD